MPNQEQHIIEICSFDNDLYDDQNWCGLRTCSELNDAIDFVCALNAFNLDGIMIWVDSDIKKFYRVRSDKMTTTYQRFI